MAYTFQRSSFSSRRAFGACAVVSSAAVCCALSISGCDDADPEAAGPGTGGSGGAGGSGGGAGDAGPSGPSGTLQVLSTAAELRAPTTAAVRGNNLWVVN